MYPGGRDGLCGGAGPAAPAASLSPVPAHTPRAGRRRHRVRTDTAFPRPVPAGESGPRFRSPGREASLPPLGRHQLRRVPARTRFEGWAGGRMRRPRGSAAAQGAPAALGGGRNPRGLCRGLCPPGRHGPGRSRSVPVPISRSRLSLGRGSQSRPFLRRPPGR